MFVIIMITLFFNVLLLIYYDFLAFVSNVLQ